MTLVTRISRLFRADVHAILDRIEEPDMLLRQAIREMEEEVARDEQRTQSLSREQGQLAKREAAIDRALAELEDELNVCFEANNDDLARSLIKRKLQAQRLRHGLEGQREALGKALSECGARIEAKRTRLTEVRQEAERLRGRTGTDYGDDGQSWPDSTVRDEDVEVALLREKQRRART